MAQAIERLLATPRTSPDFPSNAATGRESKGAANHARKRLATLLSLRRSAVLVALAAALFSVSTAAASFQPVRRGFGETALPRVRAGTVHIPAGHASGRVRVIVRLQLPPLASAPHRRTLFAAAGPRRLNVSSASSQTYLRRVAAAQGAAAMQIRRTIPQATITRRFRIVLNGLTVELPRQSLPQLLKLRVASHVYPSVRYTLAMNRSPNIIGANAYSAATGANGEGIKIGVVDDGVDETNPFFNPAGLSYPAGFPKGARRWTTPKVIVARAFPGPGSGRRGRLPIDLRESFHGTHVAGIAAGVAGTTSPGGEDHPRVDGLSGVAPGASIGNYRVFNVPSPVGNIANAPEIIAAFEAAVRDGMDIINFSGGGPETDPANDALIDAVRNVAAAGVVPVISAGNDRDDFGVGTAGSPGTAPEAISVAATSNVHVFGSTLHVTTAGAPADLSQMTFVPARPRPPAGWEQTEQTLVDVASLVGTDGRPVDPKLCGPPENPERLTTTAPPASLRGAIALVSRGTCTFLSKATRLRSLGALGMVLIDNRQGDPNPIPVRLPVPGGMIADADGTRLRSFMAPRGGQAQIRITREPLELVTGRGGIVTSFSSGGPTQFEHRLKPDVAAPGGNILSSTLRDVVGSEFAVFDGTSMAAPHVSGAVALLLQRHRSWSPGQVKSALMSTAGPAWGDTARINEAAVTLEGSGLVNIPAADDPKVFLEPSSLSFGYLNVNRGAQAATQVLGVFDGGGGGGVWSVELRPQSATRGVTLELPPAISIAPGGEARVLIVARAAADAAAGDQYGLVLLRRGDVVRRIPYLFFVTRPGLESAPVRQLRPFQIGDTRTGVSHATIYRFPAAPFGPAPDFFGPPMREEGAEVLYETHINEPVINFGVAVPVATQGSLVHPWLLGSKDENDVEGYAGTPVNVNSLSLGYQFDVGAAGAVFPRPQRFFFAVDSGRHPFTGRSLPGRYVLTSWENDLFPPLIRIVTERVSAGRPMIVARVIDFGLFRGSISGIDPTSLVLGYRGVLVGAELYDPASGFALFPLPPAAPALRAGRTRAVVAASDYQEAKNVATPGGEILPNTNFRDFSLRVVRRPTLTWLFPERLACADRRERLVVVAGSSRRLVSVRFFDGRRRIAVDRRGVAGLFAATWPTARAGRGVHVLRAVARDRAGRIVTATRPVRVCRRR
jgi:minor extracellular serine protease Vpr